MFRALKTKKDTPKYGLIYHSSLVGQASTKNKGKISRSLAAKASLATRLDAFGEESTFELGTEHRAKLETRLRILEEGNLKRLSGTGKVKAKFEKYQGKSEIKLFPTEEDNTIPIVMSKKRKISEAEKNGKKLIEEIKSEPEEEVAGPSSEKKKKKKKKAVEEEEEVVVSPKAKKAKVEEDEAAPSSEKKKKKKKKQQAEDDE